MNIQANSIAKRYNDQWIIKDLSIEIKSNTVVAITGKNGTGKSTLLKLLSGFLTPTKGTIKYTHANHTIHRNTISKHISYAAPYIAFEENFTAGEVYDYLSKIKKFNSKDQSTFLKKAQLYSDRKKYLRQYSDGMRQRLALTIALDCYSDLLLLDEPTSFLDSDYKQWFYDLLQAEVNSRTILLASNDKEDFKYCSQEINSQSFI